MASALDVSLDDLIKQRKAERKSSGAPRGGGRGGRGGRGATRGGGVGRGERGPKAGGERPARGSGNGAPEGASKIRVEGIVSSVTQEDLKELFGQGTVFALRPDGTCDLR